MSFSVIAPLRSFVGSRVFSTVSLTLVIFSAIFLGLETDKSLVQEYGDLFKVIDRAIVILFLFEVGLRIVAHFPTPHRYFKDPWNSFDAAIVVACLLPSSGPFAAVFRLARILRPLRLITHLPSLQIIVGAMLKSFKSLGTIGLLLGIFFYMFGVLGTMTFSEVAPDSFGSLSRTFLTLFQVVTLEGWADILAQVRPTHPFVAPIYFVVFIVFGTMIILNLFIGVIVNSLAEAQQEAKDESKRDEMVEDEMVDLQNKLELQKKLDLIQHQLNVLISSTDHRKETRTSATKGH